MLVPDLSVLELLDEKCHFWRDKAHGGEVVARVEGGRTPVALKFMMLSSSEISRSSRELS